MRIGRLSFLLILSVFCFISLSVSIDAGDYDLTDSQISNVESKETSSGAYTLEVSSQAPEFNLPGAEAEGGAIVVPGGEIPSEPAEEAGEKEGIKEPLEIAEGVSEEEEEEVEEEEEEEEEEEKEEEEEELEEEEEEELEEMEEAVEEGEVPPAPEDFFEVEGAPGGPYDIVISPGGKIVSRLRKTIPKTTILVIEGKVDALKISPDYIPEGFYTKDKRLYIAIVEKIGSKKLADIKIGRKIYPAYIPFPKISVALAKLKIPVIHVLACYSVRPGFKTEYDIIAIAVQLSSGQVFTEGVLSRADRSRIKELIKAIDSLRLAIDVHNEETISQIRFEEIKKLLPKEYQAMFVEEKPKEAKPGIPKPYLKIIILLAAIAAASAVAAAVFIKFKKG